MEPTPTTEALEAAERHNPIELKAQLARDLDTLAKMRRENQLAHYEPYPKQKEFHNAGAAFKERLLLASNQSGKSLSASAEVAMHCTGRYPDWWQGYRFKRPIRAWVLGVTGLATRDAAQRLLLGEQYHGTGMLPKDAITKVDANRGLPGAVDTILIKHGTGGTSQIRFKSYDQGRDRLQGSTIDLCWSDEEPPSAVYSELLARLTARKGIMLMTFTPLLGMSEVVLRFLQDESKYRHVTRMTLEDAKHFSAEERERIISNYPAHERDARTKGIPMLGSGRVYPVVEDDLAEDPIPLPDHWPRIVGMDFGYDHPTTAVWMAWDRDADVIHIYDVYRKSQETPAVHASAIRARGSWIPVAWPRDGLQHDKGSGKPLARIYELDHDLNMLPDSAEFEGGGHGVEAGVAMILDRMHTGRLKVRRDLSEWFEEFRMYHRKDGRIQKQRDDCMDAMRYAIMELRHAETEQEATRRWEPIAYSNAGIV